MRKISSLFFAPKKGQSYHEISRPGPPSYMFHKNSNNDYELGMQDIRLDSHLDDHLPLPEELKIYGLVRSRPFYEKRWFQLTCVGLIGLLAGATAVTIMAPWKNSENSAQTQNFLNVDSRLQQTISFLLASVDHRELTNTSSAQFLAAKWMADVDTLQVPLSEDAGFLQRYALALLWFATEGDEWRESVDFLTATHECDWHVPFQRSDRSVFQMGVKCNALSKVTSLTLQTLNVRGSVPKELWLLSDLEQLSLDHNSLTDFDSLRPLAHLTHLTVGYNQFATDLPTWLGEFTKLQVLGLSNNGFTSTLPSQLRQLTELRVLALDNNDMRGSLNVLEGMPWLEKLYLDDNKFTGTITNDFLRHLEILEVLDLSNNKFKGQVERGLLRRPRLEILDLHGNNLVGQLPEIPHTSSLRFLALHDNFLEGSLPSSISLLSSLEHLDLSNNRMSGDLPIADLNQMTKLEYLFLATNRHFTPGPIPDFSPLTNLRELSLKETARTGFIPSWIVQLSNLILLDLDNNRLNSTIPSALAQLSNLNYLILSRNQLTGKVPVELSSIQKLNLLLLDQNDLTGDVDRLCPLELPVLIADCSEVRCNCCTVCCVDSDPEGCLDTGWMTVFNYDPIWENGYTRDSFQVLQNEVFSPEDRLLESLEMGF